MSGKCEICGLNFAELVIANDNTNCCERCCLQLNDLIDDLSIIITEHELANGIDSAIN